MERSGVCCRCALPVEGAVSSFVCEDCRRFKPAFDSAVSALDFSGEARDIVLRYKFSGGIWLRNDFTDWVEAAVRARYNADLIDAVVPMPITAWHEADRGYNQCQLIAETLSRRLDRRLLDDAVIRCGNPKRQSNLSAEERRGNVKDTFCVVRPDLVRGRTILLVDDIMTTGSTLSECSAELKRAGAWRVLCATIARSMR